MGEPNYFATSLPAKGIDQITPNDSNKIGPYVSLLVGTAGTFYVDTVNGETNRKVVAPAGVLPLQVTKVYATGLVDAADIQGFKG